jgi:hypothetical protein
MLARWFASLPVTIVAGHSILVGLIASAAEAAAWIDWGHEALLLAAVPILARAVALETLPWNEDCARHDL